MQYVVIARDFTDSDALKRRLAAREAHLKMGDAKRAKGELLYAAAILDGADKMTGSVMILEFPGRADLDRWLQEEPYVIGKVWEKIEVQPCRVGPSFQRNPSAS